MNRTARCALLVLGFQLSWPLAFAQPLESPPQDPIAGARVFGVKGCAACHAATRAGPPTAPDLRHPTSPRSLANVASAMWNHRPHVSQFTVRDARLDPRETGHLLAFLFTLDYWSADGAAGDAAAGRRLFIEKQCVVCHQVAGIGGVVGPRLDSFRQYHSPILLAATMWNHGPQMTEVMRANGIERPLFRGTELRDLIAYLKAESAVTDLGPLHVLPGDAERGRRLFADHHCMECHGGDTRGRSLVGRGTGRDLTEFATVMWNKTPAMLSLMKRRAIVIAPLHGDEMADLVAYLDAVGYFADPGNAKRGQTLASEKGCRVCHAVSGLGARAGSERSRRGAVEAPAIVLSFAWNHALLIEDAAGQATATWRPFTAGEMADLMAFIRWGGSGARDGPFPGTIQTP